MQVWQKKNCENDVQMTKVNENVEIRNYGEKLHECAPGEFGNKRTWIQMNTETETCLNDAYYKLGLSLD